MDVRIGCWQCCQKFAKAKFFEQIAGNKLSPRFDWTVQLVAGKAAHACWQCCKGVLEVLLHHCPGIKCTTCEHELQKHGRKKSLRREAFQPCHGMNE